MENRNRTPWRQRLGQRLGLTLATLATVTGAHALTAARLPDQTILGNAADAQIGGWMNAQVDINRDGFPDLISSVSTPGQRGAVEVRYGNGKGGFSAAPNFRYDGTMEYEQVGSSPQAVDVNGDGWPDLVVGAYNRSGAQQYAGAVLVFFGSANGFAATPSQVIEGFAPNQFFGFAIRPLGDFNRDGYADIAVSAGDFFSGASQIFVYSGSANGLTFRPESTITGNFQGFAYFGRVFDTGDVNGDGIADIVVGVSSSNSQGRPGLVLVYRGTATGYSSTPSQTLVGPSYLERTDGYGASVSILGDINGDGFVDLAVGVPDYLPPDASGLTISFGQILIYYGTAQGFVAQPSQTLQAPDADGFGFFGEVILGKRDFNGDGYADLIVGASLRQQGLTQVPLPFPGFVWLYTGGPAGFAKAPYKRAGRAGSAEGMGSSLEAVDVNRDGQMDLISGSPTFSGPLPAQGAIKIYRGARGLK